MEVEEQAVPVQPSTEVLHGAAAGVVSGVVSRFLTFPADTLKARLQVSGALVQGSALNQTKNSHIPLTRAACDLYKVEGLLGFYRGFSTVLVGALPGQAAYFGGYEVGKGLIPQGYGILGDMGVGCLAQLIAGLAFTPIDVIKERLQVRTLMLNSRLPHDSHAADLVGSISHILKHSGPLGLLKGYWATNCVWLPWNILYIGMYEAYKRSAHAYLSISDSDPLPPPATMACAFTASSVAAVITHPPDVVKTRLQVLSSEKVSLTFWKVASDLVHKEGLSAMWSGVGARILMMGPGAAISWAVYEEVKKCMVQV